MSNEAVAIDQSVIQKEILRNGAVVAEFAAPNRFKYYSECVLSELGPDHHEYLQLDSQLSMATQNLDHSVAIIGWGRDDKSGTDVWICRNSFGKEFGDSGDFYVRRGQNDFGIESEINAYEIAAM